MVTAATETDSGGEPLARVQGEPVLEWPQDLYIPPDALEVFLDAFEGPLDLLLYLIRRNNLDIRDIPIAEITRQYMHYVELMRAAQLDLAAEYLVMAATLAEIKSRVLLPRPAGTDEEAEEDPRAELIRRLQTYEQFKQAAEWLDMLPREGRDVHPVAVACDTAIAQPVPQVEVSDLIEALQGVLKRASLQAHHHVQREPLSVRERMGIVLHRLGEAGRAVAFTELLVEAEHRAGVVVTFLAVLELARESLVTLLQAEPGSPVYVEPVGG